MRVLVVASVPPWPLTDGVSLVLHHQVRRLAHRHEITILAASRPPAAAAPDLLEIGLPANVDVQWFGAERAGPREYARRRWRSLRSGEPADAYRVEVAPLLAALDQQLASSRPDVVHLHGWGTAQLVHRLGPTPAVHAALDAWSIGFRTVFHRARWRRALEAGQYRKVVRYEARHYPACASVVVVAHADADAITRLAPTARVEVVANGVEPGPEPAAPAAAPVIGFHGVLTTIANRKAAWALLDEVLPRVRRQAPDARALVIGREPEPALLARRSSQVEITGEVPDVRAELARVAVYVAPMFQGSGIKNKVLEAMAAGLPVVATPQALDGIGEGPGVVAAATPDAIADAVVNLLGDAEARSCIGRAGRARVVEDFGWDANAGAIERLWIEATRR